MAPSKQPQERGLSVSQFLIACWGVFGVLALLGQALYRLTPLAIEPVAKGMLTPPLWALYIGWTIFNAYAEGYKGFQRGFAPRVVGRALYLARNPRLGHVIAAPFFCMALFHARRKNLILAWGLTTLIVVAVLLVKMLPQPWRGIVDAGVVAGLAWGVVALVVFFIAAIRGRAIPPHKSLPPTSAQAPTG